MSLFGTLFCILIFFRSIEVIPQAEFNQIYIRLYYEKRYQRWSEEKEHEFLLIQTISGNIEIIYRNIKNNQETKNWMYSILCNHIEETQWLQSIREKNREMNTFIWSVFQIVNFEWIINIIDIHFQELNCILKYHNDNYVRKIVR